MMRPKYEVYIKSKDLNLKKAKSYSSIIADLNSVKKALKKIHKYDDANVTQAIFAFSIITYARVFVSGERTKLKIDEFKSLSTAEKDFHEELIDMRHQYIAHAGNNAYEEVKIILLLNETKNFVLNNIHEKIMMFNFNQSRIDLFVSLISKIENKVNKKCELFIKKYLSSLPQVELEKFQRSAVAYNIKGSLYAADYKVTKEK